AGCSCPQSYPVQSFRGSGLQADAAPPAGGAYRAGLDGRRALPVGGIAFRAAGRPVPTRAQYIHVLLDATPPTGRSRLTPWRWRLFGEMGCVGTQRVPRGVRGHPTGPPPIQRRFRRSIATSRVSEFLAK